ncbi:MAG: DUF2070 family protein [Candidatus Thermoplasmatota archaeon]
MKSNGLEGLAKYIFTAPKPVYMVLPILIVSIVSGFLITQPMDLYRSLYIGIIIFALPAYLSAIFSKPLANALDGILYFRRAMLLSFISVFILSIIVIVIGFSQKFFAIPKQVNWKVIIIFGYAVVLWLSYVILVATSNSSIVRSLPVAIIQPFVGIICVGAVYHLSKIDIIYIIAFFTIFLFSALLYIRLAKGPFKRVYGIESLELMKSLLSHWTEGGREGSVAMERFFHSFSSPTILNFSVLSIRRKKNNDIKAIIIVPTVHPGPFGSIGGGDLPRKIANVIRKSLGIPQKNIFVFHGATTHDLNPATTLECEKIGLEIAKMVEKMSSYFSSFAPYMKTELENCTVSSQILGNSILLFCTSSPLPTEDIEYQIAQEIRIYGRRFGNIMFIDAHNCIEKGSGIVFSGSRKGRGIIKCARNAIEKANNEVRDGVIKVGIGSAKGFDVEAHGIGSQGIQAMVIEAGDKINALILFDGNNIVKGLRERIISDMKEKYEIDEVEVFTTDNHCVNVTIEGHNPIGEKLSSKKILDITEKVLEKGIENLEEVEFCGKSTNIEVNVFGSGNTARLVTAIESTVSVLKIGAFFSLAFATLLSILFFIVI